jgi:tetratricopeptide (TPR) repeat protein
VALRSSLTPIDPIAVAADEAVLAACLAGSGERDAARALFDKVLRTVEEGYGPDHYEVAVAVHNLAALDPNPSEAEKGYLRALTIKMRRLGVRHPEVGALWANLGALYASCGRTGDAEAAYARALPIVTRGWGNEHPATVALRANMARFS